MDDWQKSRIPNFKRVLFSFKVLHEGWELDNDAWLVELTDGSRALVATNHGGAHIAEREYFEEKIAEYERVIADTRHAIAMETRRADTPQSGSVAKP